MTSARPRLPLPTRTPTASPRPIFRPFLPTVGGTRTFPALQHILNSANVPPTFTSGFLTGELLPAIGRTMTFKVIARDNRANGGGIHTALSVITVDGPTGPFAITSPNTTFDIQRLTNFTVTWNVAGTNGVAINAQNVKISLSTDGGNTFPTVLAASTANDGSEVVLIPDMLTTTGRMKIEAVGNIFFDISNANFNITTTPGPTPTPAPTPTPTPGVTPAPTPSPVPTATPTPTPTPPLPHRSRHQPPRQLRHQHLPQRLHRVRFQVRRPLTSQPGC